MNDISTPDEGGNTPEVVTEEKDYKKLFEDAQERIKEQERGVQKVLSENKTLKDKLAPIEMNMEVDEILIKEYPNFSELDQTQQSILREAKLARLENQRYRAVDQEKKRLIERDTQIESILTNSPEIKDKKAEFKEFIKKNPNVSIDILADSFKIRNGLYSQPVGSSKSVGTSTPSPREIVEKTELEKMEDKFMNMKSPKQKQAELAQKLKN